MQRRKHRCPCYYTVAANLLQTCRPAHKQELGSDVHRALPSPLLASLACRKAFVVAVVRSCGVHKQCRAVLADPTASDSSARSHTRRCAQPGRRPAARPTGRRHRRCRSAQSAPPPAPAASLPGCGSWLRCGWPGPRPGPARCAAAPPPWSSPRGPCRRGCSKKQTVSQPVTATHIVLGSHSLRRATSRKATDSLGAGSTAHTQQGARHTFERMPEQQNTRLHKSLGLTLIRACRPRRFRCWPQRPPHTRVLSGHVGALSSATAR